MKLILTTRNNLFCIALQFQLNLLEYRDRPLDSVESTNKEIPSLVFASALDRGVSVFLYPFSMFSHLQSSGETPEIC